MTAIPVKIEWARQEALFTDNRYSRAHRWTFDGGAEVVFTEPVSKAGLSRFTA